MKSEEKINPLVSIVIPVYNGSNYLREAIGSALVQTYKNIEVIVVNDGSTDDTEKIAKSYGDKIRYFSKENGGVSSALNLGIREMKGEYFSWLSHDDVYYPEKVEKQIKFFAELKDKNVVLYSDYDLVDGKSQIIRTEKKDHEMLEAKPEYALFRSAINGCTMLVPKKAFSEHGFFDEKLKCTQDYAKWFEIMKSYSFIHIPEVLIKYRLHELQDTNKNPIAESEGDALWIMMMKNLPVEAKERLEGNELEFFKQMAIFLKNTPYKKAAEFAEKKVSEILPEKKAEQLSVIFVAHSSGSYGAEKALLNIIDILKKKDVLIYVVLPYRGPLEQELKARSICYSIENITCCVNVENSRINEVQNIIFNNAQKLAVMFDKINPDIIFTSTSVVNEGAIAAKMLNISHVWNIAEFGREEHGVKYMLPENERLKFIDQHSDKIFFVSETLKNYYSQKNDISKKSFVFPPIVSNVLLKNATGKKYFHSAESFKIVLVGSIAKGKGQKDALLAVKELLKSNGKNVELVMAGIVGNQNYYAELQNIIKEERMDGNVIFAGHVDEPDVLFAQTDVVLMCSIFEAFGRVTVEAMLSRKPVIGANSGATPELIRDNESGFLYEPGDHKSLANKMQYFIDHREKIKEFGENGYNFVKEKFDEKNIGDKLFNELYALKGKKERYDIAVDAWRLKNQLHGTFLKYRNLAKMALTEYKKNGLGGLIFSVRMYFKQRTGF